MGLPPFLTDQVTATYVVALLTIGAGIIGFFISKWMNRKRPRVVMVSKVKESSLVEIDPRVKDEIKIKYKGDELDSLYLTGFMLQNTSEDIVKSINLTIQWTTSNILEALNDDNVKDRKKDTIITYDDSKLEFTIPFLNSKKIYDDKIGVEIYSASPIKVLHVEGGGPEWKVNYFDDVEFREDLTSDLSATIKTVTESPIPGSSLLTVVLETGRIAAKILSSIARNL